MEEEKAAAYYDELTRKGSGAARFKQGLGFSSNDNVSERGSALPSSSSFLSTFVKASISGPSEIDEVDKQAQLQSIQQKLKSKSKSKSNSNDIQRSRVEDESQRRRSHDRDKYTNSKHRSRSRDNGSRSRENYSKSSYKSRSRSRSRDRHRNSKRRSRSRSRERYSRRRSRSRERSLPRRSRSSSRDRSLRRRSRSSSRERSSRRRSRSRNRGNEGRGRRNESSPKGRRGEKSVKDESKVRVDYSRLIQGYDQMAPAERVKAKMKLQLTETAQKDPTRGTGSGWERFDFDKDATLDDEEELEAAEDDSALVKHIGQSFRFSAVEAKKEDQIKAAHDEAMFGAPTLQLTPDIDEDKDDSPICTNDSAPDTSLLSNQVISMQQVSWRDRVKKM